MSLAFASPWALTLILLLPIYYLIGYERLARLPQPTRRLALVLRLIIVSLLVIALAQPLLGRTNENLSVVFAIDASDSIPPESQAAAREWVDQALTYLAPEDRTGVVVFGGEAFIQQGLGSDGFGTGGVQPSVERTNIAQALRLAMIALPRDGGRRVVLLSDGQENVGRAEEEARYIAEQGVQISVVPAAPPTEMREVFIESVDVPPYVREGEGFDLTVTLYSTHQTQGVLSVFADGIQLAETVVDLRPGASRYTIALTAIEQGFRSFLARIDSASDTYRQNNEMWAYTVVREPGRVLAITDAPEDLGMLESVLSASGISVDVQPTSFIPSRLSPMREYQSVLLLNVPAASLSLDQMKTLTSFVQSLGRGLVVIGGDSSYSLGGYAETPLAEALPVTMNVPGKLEEGTIGVLLVIDRSGSMDIRDEGVTRIEMARQAAINAVSVLDPTDQVGVLAFDTVSEWIVPFQVVGDRESRQKVFELIDELKARGGTQIHQALDIGYEALRRVPARYKHIILLSDGLENRPADYYDLIVDMQLAGITLSTIAIGADADLELMQHLADKVGGRYYYIESARDVPQVTMRETRIASGSAAVDGVFQPTVATASPILRSISESQLPQLGGYVVTTPKSTAQVVLTSEIYDPVLVHWHYGLGRVVSWTSDVTANWADEWLDWPEFDLFWTQAVRWSMPSPTDPRLQISSAVEGRYVTIRVDVTDDEGIYQDLVDVRIQVSSKEGQSDEMPLLQTKPGRYEVGFTVEGEGAYQVDVFEYQGESVVRSETGGVVVPYPSEYRAFGIDADLIGRLTRLTGGSILRDPEESFWRDLDFRGQTRYPIWHWFVGTAILLFPLDVGVRRLKLSPDFARRKIWLPIANAAVWAVSLVSGRWKEEPPSPEDTDDISSPGSRLA